MLIKNVFINLPQRTLVFKNLLPNTILILIFDFFFNNKCYLKIIKAIKT